MNFPHLSSYISIDFFKQSESLDKVYLLISLVLNPKYEAKPRTLLSAFNLDSISLFNSFET